MPRITSSSPQQLAPSLKGSTPVSEVLNRIQVRDPAHSPSGVYGRRLTDFESHSPVLQAAALFVLGALMVAGFWSVSFQKLATSWNSRHISVPKMQETLNVPREIHPLPQSIRRPPPLA